MNRNEIIEIVEAVIDVLEKRRNIGTSKKTCSRKTQEDRDTELVSFILQEVRERSEVSKAELLYRSHAKLRDFHRALELLIERGDITLTAQHLRTGK